MTETNTRQKLMHEAQKRALDWLIGQCEDQFVRAWIVSKRDQIDSIGYAINYNGTEMSHK